MGDLANRGHATSVPVPDSARSMSQGTPTMDTVMEAPIDGHSECGSMRISESELRYVGGDHWAAILDGIADIKDHFDRDEQLRLANTPDQLSDEPTHDPSRPRSGYALLLYGCRKIASRGEILAALPPKAAVDRYISRFFNFLDLVSACSYSPLCSIRVCVSGIDYPYSSRSRSKLFKRGKFSPSLALNIFADESSMRHFGRIHLAFQSCGSVFYSAWSALPV